MRNASIQGLVADAITRFEEVFTAAQGGDFGARGELGGVSQGLLDARRAFFGSSTGFFEGALGFNEIIASLQDFISVFPTSADVTGFTSPALDLTGQVAGQGTPHIHVEMEPVEVTGVSSAEKQDEQTEVLGLILAELAEIKAVNVQQEQRIDELSLILSTQAA